MHWETFLSFILLLKHDYRLICFIMHNLFFLYECWWRWGQLMRLWRTQCMMYLLDVSRCLQGQHLFLFRLAKGDIFAALVCQCIQNDICRAHLTSSLLDTKLMGSLNLFGAKKSIREIMKIFYIEASIQMNNKLLPLRELDAMFFLLWVVKQNTAEKNWEVSAPKHSCESLNKLN